MNQNMPISKHTKIISLKRKIKVLNEMPSDLNEKSFRSHKILLIIFLKNEIYIFRHKNAKLDTPYLYIVFYFVDIKSEFDYAEFVYF